MSANTAEKNTDKVKDHVDLADLDWKTINNMSEEEIAQYQLDNIAQNTRATQEGNQAQTIGNKDNARDSQVNAQVGLQRAWGEAIFAGVGIVSSFTSQGAQRGLKPLLDGLKQVFTVYMAIKDQSRSLAVASKQEENASNKLKDMGINPDTKKPMSVSEKRKWEDEKYETEKREIKNFLNKGTMTSEEHDIALSNLNRQYAHKIAALQKPATPMTPAA